MAWIDTERTLIRNFVSEDFNDLHDILSDPIVMEYTEPPYDEVKTHKFLEEFCIQQGRGLAVEHKADRRVIGYILFSDRLEQDVYEVGWIFHKDYWRCGYAYEALRALFDYAFLEKHAHKLFAEAIDETKSVGLMKKLGMMHEGTQRKQVRDNNGIWRDLYYYGLLQEDHTASGS